MSDYFERSFEQCLSNIHWFLVALLARQVARATWTSTEFSCSWTGVCSPGRRSPRFIPQLSSCWAWNRIFRGGRIMTETSSTFELAGMDILFRSWKTTHLLRSSLSFRCKEIHPALVRERDLQAIFSQLNSDKRARICSQSGRSSLSGSTHQTLLIPSPGPLP